jgi:hypothetical protein
MTLQGIGYGVMDDGSAWRLDRKLSQLVDEGFSHAGVRPEGWQVCKVTPVVKTTDRQS